MMKPAKTYRELLDEKQAAIRLGVKEGTLQVWRCKKRYDLPFIRIGRTIRYDAAEIEKFLKRNTVDGGGNSTEGAA
jgi:hypothetical protein